ncbi:sigma-70 family RNA polymerase sigma factor [Bacillus sp. HMF5848]|uniref:RNA polymerase sigma factor n=1 Tax=Bacillus sp. HMF5848 TaxID=2495421 RepID=UPI000F78CF21|nr:sigma-70 family RNA polymerase sigma factor [Bacillus sp. HMF5848]RSK25647.1 sigma-70 family RNA polymerase sigma factor [Bacillus sp. HMF5848]
MDQKLIELCMQGSNFAQQRLIVKYKTLLYSFARKLTKNKDDADDLFQDTWLKVFQKLHTYDGTKPFENWLCYICLNTYRDQYRKKKRWLNIVTDFFLSNEQKDLTMDTAPTPRNQLVEDIVIQHEEHDYLIQAMQQLDDSFRIPLILFYFQSFSYEEIANFLHIPVGTVRSRLSNAKKKLKNILEGVD